jgi:oxalyl-CoA decarboxylase
MAMAKGLLPDTHDSRPAAAGSYVLPEADVVMLMAPVLNWLLSHGKGKTWGGKSSEAVGRQKFIQIDISPQEADSNVRIDAPLVGDIGSASRRCSTASATRGRSRPRVDRAIAERKTKNIAKMARRSRRIRRR